ncbi:predicted protein [Naegleria gruberi]|uniref:Predicted protein n=1 Tax=Naegleria gruberi TaxID=5762 RepID=D2VYE6_NAEGR|nr:uncharacterized protein NAEGRDRAFT_74093 [Naegleria gruberi]EFC38227.1 predicted protein [Naegleria gruberi]|eukprot:XP_002670971.1 predicted protein [Naegleria gruberi strain NEG-M]
MKPSHSNNQPATTPQFLNYILKQLTNKSSNKNSFPIAPSSIVSNNNTPSNNRQAMYSSSKNNNRKSNNNVNNGHRKKRNIQKPIKIIQSRSWFGSEDDWLQGNVVPVQSPSFLLFNQTDSSVLKQDSNNKQSVVSAFDFFKVQRKESVAELSQNKNSSLKTIIANTDQSVCPICEEDLDKSYDSQRMNWVLSEAEFSPSLQLYVHSNCSNSKKRKVIPNHSPVETLKKVKI